MNTTSFQRTRTFVGVALALLAMCVGGCTSMTPGQMGWVKTDSDKPRAGNVYLLRGWIGIFSYGINDLGDKINKDGVRASVYQDDQWHALADTIRAKYKGARTAEPLVLIGHSFGADDVVRVAQELAPANVTVDLLVTLDPVTPPDVPPNVKRVVNLYQSNGAWDKVPAFRGVPLKLAEGSHAQLVNADVKKDRTDLLEPGTDHFNIEKKGKIHQEVLKYVLETCPPRQAWARANGVNAATASSTPAKPTGPMYAGPRSQQQAGNAPPAKSTE